MATKTRPGTALYRRLRWPAVCPAVVAGAGLGGRGDRWRERGIFDMMI